MDSSILLVEDDQLHLEILYETLTDNAYGVTRASNGQQAADALNGAVFSVALIDICLPDVDGMALLELIVERQPECIVLLMTGQASVEAAVAAMKRGAYDYLPKPFRTELLLLKLKRLFRLKQLETENRSLRKAVRGTGMIGESTALRRFVQSARNAAETDATVLLEGESGTGKELAADYIQAQSERRDAPFIKVNCGAIPETLLESELFGFEKGAFTGANKQHIGFLEQAHGGTLFLDEVGEIPHNMQVKLLRVLQDGTFARVGSEKVQKVDFRLIAATHQDMEDLRKEGIIREDFFYRLNVIPLRLPVLRSRRDDIPLLIDFFIHKYSERYGKNPIRLTPETMDQLLRYPFPGNIRELQNMIERLQVLYPGEHIGPRKLPDVVRNEAERSGEIIQCFRTGLPLREAVRDFEIRFISRVLEEEKGNRTNTSKRLGISRKALWEKLA